MPGLLCGQRCRTGSRTATLQTRSLLMETAPASTVAAEFVGIEDGVFTVRGSIDLKAQPERVYGALKDYESSSRVFHNIMDTIVQSSPEGSTQLLQVSRLGASAHLRRLCPDFLTLRAHTFFPQLPYSLSCATGHAEILGLVSSAFAKG